MQKEFEINGCVSVPPDVTDDEFSDAFLGFLESKGWYFGGGIIEIQDGFYIKPDGSKGKSVMTNFDDYLKEQLEDPELRAEYEALEPVFSLMQAMIDARKNTDC